MNKPVRIKSRQQAFDRRLNDFWKKKGLQKAFFQQKTTKVKQEKKIHENGIGAVIENISATSAII